MNLCPFQGVPRHGEVSLSKVELTAEVSVREYVIGHDDAALGFHGVVQLVRPSQVREHLPSREFGLTKYMPEGKIHS